jgi:hypothetical protein
MKLFQLGDRAFRIGITMIFVLPVIISFKLIPWGFAASILVCILTRLISKFVALSWGYNTARNLETLIVVSCFALVLVLPIAGGGR